MNQLLQYCAEGAESRSAGVGHSAFRLGQVVRGLSRWCLGILGNVAAGMVMPQVHQTKYSRLILEVTQIHRVLS